MKIINPANSSDEEPIKKIAAIITSRFLGSGIMAIAIEYIVNIFNSFPVI